MNVLCVMCLETLSHNVGTIRDRRDRRGGELSIPGQLKSEPIVNCHDYLE